jgi:thiocyanate hydrolase subunit gamma
VQSLLARLRCPIETTGDISELEVGELAVREPAIQNGLFTQEDLRRFSEWAETIVPSGGSKLAADSRSAPATQY